MPTFVINEQWAIPGAQDTATFVNVLRRLRDKIALDLAAAAPACADDVCDT